MEKYQDSDDLGVPDPALLIKEQRAEVVKHHLWVQWRTIFKSPHFEKYPKLHELNRATKAAGATGAKGSVDPADGQKLARPDRRDRHDLLGNQNDGASTTPSASSESPTPDLARITTDNPTKQGNPGRPLSFYQRPAAHLDGPDEVAESAPI
jgi:nickel-containing superoxide dismutase